MLVGLISDTHIPSRAEALPDFVAQAFRGVDLILHAGDINDMTVLRALNDIALTEAVAGNTDPAGLAAALGFQLELDLAGFRVGLTHGHLGRGRTTPERALNTFPGAQVVVFGHSHNPLVLNLNGVLLVNPGSPTDKRRQAQYSLGLLSLKKRPEAKLLWFD